VTIFARKSQKLINEMKEVNNFQNDLTWTVARAISCHLGMFYSVLCHCWRH
jgi:hypothetical protein